MVVFGLVIGILFLEETHEDKQDRRDYGLEAGDWLMSRFRSDRCPEKGSFGEESLTLLVDAPPGYSSSVSSPTLNPLSVGELPNPVRQVPETDRTAAAVSNAFTRQTIFNIVGYGILA